MSIHRAIRTRLLLCVTATLAALALAQPASSSAITGVPRVATGGASHVRGGSALLSGAIIPNGVETSYYFDYGPTIAYGLRTPTLKAGNGTAKVRVGQIVTRLTQGALYHFRLVAVANGVALPGRDHTFIVKGAPLAFTVAKTGTDTYGTPFILTGKLTGVGAAGHRVTLQASPFPFLEAFSEIGLPAVTNSAGTFSFRVANLTESTQFRVATLDALPVYSPVITVQVVPRIVLHVHSSKTRGVVRLFGTISPAVNGATIALQVQKAVRPGKREISVRWVSQFSTVAKKAPHGTSRFSIIAAVRHGGRYRAYVKEPNRAKFASGPSLNTVVLRAAPASALRTHK